jgi:hypothetical protein
MRCLRKLPAVHLRILHALTRQGYHSLHRDGVTSARQKVPHPASSHGQRQEEQHQYRQKAV